MANRSFLKSLGRALASVKLAIIIIVSLAISLAVATTLESSFDTPTAQYWVYRSWWFRGVLTALGINILAVMVNRWPWKPRHLPFLLAHIGILTLLTGSWMTERFGIDASMRITEGETSSVIDIDDNVFSLMDNQTSYRVHVPWIPPNASFKPIQVAEQGIPYDLTVDRYISRADPVYDFIPSFATPTPQAQPRPALEFEIVGGVMKIRQAVWMWTGHPSWNRMVLGPAEFRFGAEGPPPEKGHPALVFSRERDGSLSYVAATSEGGESHGRFPASQIAGSQIEPGWRGGVQVRLLKYIPDAIPSATYKPSREQYGKNAPPSAIHVIAGKGGNGSEVWLGMGEHAVLETPKGEVEIGYNNRRLVLPFGIKLNHFTIDTYQGTRDPSSYRSDVTVVSGPGQQPQKVTISMNEPLHHSGVTFYQASYEEGDPRPVVSIFSVNRDPGRPWKYAGSLMIVSGAILLFAVKYKKRQQPQGRPA